MIGGIAIEQAIPTGKVFSFPKEIKCVNYQRYIHLNYALGVRMSIELIEDDMYMTILKSRDFYKSSELRNLL